MSGSTVRPRGRGLRKPLVVAVLSALGLSTMAAAYAQQVTIEPTLSLSVTATQRSGSDAAGSSSELVTQISPGVTASSRGAALQGSLNYSANMLLYANDSQSNRITHSLASAGRYSLLSGRAGVDMSASASEQVVSAFGIQGGDTAGQNNRAQTFSYSLAPFLSGQLLGQTTYQVRASYSGSRTGSSAVGASESYSGSANVGGRFGRLGWGLNASAQVSDSDVQDRSRSGRAFASLSYSPDVEVQLSARYGRDLENIQTGQSESSATWGVSAAWIPGPRTSMSVDYDRRYFGDSHAVTFSHRMARTIWTYSDSRDVQTQPTVGRFELSAYELFYNQFASIEPDPVKREQLVRGFLAARGIDPNGRVVLGGFLTSLASVQRRQQATVAYQGLRYTLLVGLSSGTTRSIVQGASGNDDLASGNAVSQRGLTLTLSHSLGAHSSLVFNASWQRTPDAGTQSGNESRSFSGTWSMSLGTRTSASVGVRYTSFDSDTSPYNESSIFGTLGLRF